MLFLTLLLQDQQILTSRAWKKAANICGQAQLHTCHIPTF